MTRLVWFAVLLALPRLAPAVTLRMPPVVVPPHSERQVCQYIETRVGRPDQMLAGYRVRVRGHSHHFNLFDASGVIPATREQRDGPPSACVPDGGMPRLVATIGPVASLRLPDDIRLPWQIPQPLVMDLHVVNPTSRPRTVRTRVHLRLRRAPVGVRIATRWGVRTDDIAVQPFTTATVGTSWIAPAAIGLLTFGGHMHAQGIVLRAYRDDVLVYEQRDWRHPVEVNYRSPELLPAGTTLRVECLYDNGVERPVFRCDDGTPCPLVWGERAVDAMCNLQ
ncbi:MAG TPA: hypothetical protein VGR62_14285, partial [Candidatus Binatia bacterium]|nr:hypothetical protein [Candidatus Binatia bacterium]